MTVYNTVKRFLDYALALFGLIIAVPLILLIALTSLLLQGRPVFYTSTRFIRREKAVKILKFRSMVPDATSRKYDLKGRFMHEGYLDIPLDCEVYTPFGRILERTELVELPQIFNVLINGMSLVGNRALPEENVLMLGAFPGWERRFESPCGLTGISQVVGKQNLEPQDRLHLESLYSIVYAQGNVLKADFFILLATARLILRAQYMPYDDAVALLESCI